MKLLSVNVSPPREVRHRGRRVTTGIFKEPVTGRVRLGRTNLEGDGQADLEAHGGPNKAVYVYSVENHRFWEAELSRTDLAPGMFGENFTVEGMGEDDVHVGDVFRVGTARVQVTQPRVPCYKLDLRLGVEGFNARFLKSGRVGFYFRVLEEGEVGPGDPIERVETHPQRMTVRQISDLLYFQPDNVEDAERALAIDALSPGWKESFDERLAKAEALHEAWDGWRTFVVAHKRPESETITSFYLEPEDGKPLPSYRPGQFLTFKLDIPGQAEPVLRTYTLSAGPGDPERYRVSIKREPPQDDYASSSNYFHDHVVEGSRLQVKAPRGKFFLDLESGRPAVLLSAGVGLTPMVSMLEAAAASGFGHPLWFVHGTRNGREHAMGAHVRRIAAEHPDAHVHIRYSRPDAGDVAGQDYDSTGHVDVDLLKRILPFDAYDFYLCGPTGFMAELYRGLTALGVPEARIHYEFFGPATDLHDRHAKPERAAALEAVTGQIEVQFARSGVTVHWEPECDTILELAEKHGLSPDFSCRSGICGTCESTVVSGEVHYVEEPTAEPDDGNALICCSRPATNLVLDI